jgi:hypothetical protein
LITEKMKMMMASKEDNKRTYVADDAEEEAEEAEEAKDDRR